MTASDVAEKVEISVQKASALLRQIDGLNVSEIKVKGKGKVKGYALA
jgi:DNA-binding transcriptional regulator GbsR (MarR family)